MAGSWREARDLAKKHGNELVYHDFDTGIYGFCMKTDRPGHFSCGSYVEHRCICMPIDLEPGELEQKEKRFLDDNPDWFESS